MKIDGLRVVCGQSRKLKKSKLLHIFYDRKQKSVACLETDQSMSYLGCTDKYISMMGIEDMVIKYEQRLSRQMAAKNKK